MSLAAEDWSDIAATLGYATWEEMLVDLYTNQTMSISKIAKVLGYSTGAVLRRLKLLNIPIRKRGGKNHVQNKLHGVPLVEFATPKEVAKKYNVHLSTVFTEMRKRGIHKCSTSQSPPLQ